jgi:hypothetical protein
MLCWEAVASKGFKAWRLRVRLAGMAKRVSKVFSTAAAHLCPAILIAPWAYGQQLLSNAGVLLPHRILDACAGTQTTCESAPSAGTRAALPRPGGHSESTTSYVG